MRNARDLNSEFRYDIPEHGVANMLKQFFGIMLEREGFGRRRLLEAEVTERHPCHLLLQCLAALEPLTGGVWSHLRTSAKEATTARMGRA